MQKKFQKKDKSFLEDLSKGFKFKAAYATAREDKNNTEKAYDDLLFVKKTIDNVLYKDAKKKFNNKNKNIFQKAKKFDLRVKIYKKLIFERENLKFEESVAEREN